MLTYGPNTDMVWNIYTCLKINIKHIGVCELGNKLFDRTIMFWDIKIKKYPIFTFNKEEDY